MTFNLRLLTNEIWFPPVEEAREDGLLAVGGDLNTDRLLLAYRSGIFPWYDEDEMRCMPCLRVLLCADASRHISWR